MAAGLAVTGCDGDAGREGGLPDESCHGAKCDASDAGDAGGEQEAPPVIGACCLVDGFTYWDDRAQCGEILAHAADPNACAIGGAGAPPFEVFTPGDANTDQATAAPAQSGLSTFRGPGVLASDYAAMVTAADVNANAWGASVQWMHFFSQCFSGGFLDDLDAAGGVHMATTSARHDEVAYYPSAANPTDWGNALVNSLAGGVNQASQLAVDAAQDDDFAPAFEHPNYLTVGGGDRSDLALGVGLGGIAILWSGQPTMIDARQINEVAHELKGRGYRGNRIFVFYGDGTLTPPNPAGGIPGHPLLAEHLGDPLMISGATGAQLQRLFNAAWGGGWARLPEFAFVFANDHGYNTAINNGGATPQEGDTYPDQDAYDGDYPAEPDFPDPDYDDDPSPGDPYPGDPWG